MSLHSASGHTVKSFGKATIKMCIDNDFYTVEFVITDGFKFDILIGSDFIYRHKALLDFANNTMILNKKIICLRPKHELSKCGLLQVTSFQSIEPYSISHIEVRSKSTVKGTCVVSPLNNHTLFKDQPGLVAPSITVNANRKGRYYIPIINNTGIRHTVSINSVLGFIEEIQIQNNTTQSQENVVHNYTPGISKHCNNVVNVDNIDVKATQPLANIGDHVTGDQKTELDALLHKYDYLFINDNTHLSRTNVIQATLNTGDSLPIKQRPYKNPLALQAQVDEQIDDMLNAGIVSPSCSPWCAPIVVVPKRDGTQRICIDYRRLNQSLVKDSFPLPRIEDLFATLGKAKYFSCLDLKSGYWQIELAPEDREKTAFCTRTQLLEFNVLPFGIASAPAIFQRMISTVLKGIDGKFAVAYLDDILVYSETFEDHIEHIKNVFDRLKEAFLSLNKNKCHFIKEEIDYLGHVISNKGIKPNPEKIRAIQTLDPPTTVKGVRSF